MFLQTCTIKFARTLPGTLVGVENSFESFCRKPPKVGFFLTNYKMNEPFSE